MIIEFARQFDIIRKDNSTFVASKYQDAVAGMEGGIQIEASSKKALLFSPIGKRLFCAIKERQAIFGTYVKVSVSV